MRPSARAVRHLWERPSTDHAAYIGVDGRCGRGLRRRIFPGEYSSRSRVVRRQGFTTQRAALVNLHLQETSRPTTLRELPRTFAATTGAPPEVTGSRSRLAMRRRLMRMLGTTKRWRRRIFPGEYRDQPRFVYSCGCSIRPRARAARRLWKKVSTTTRHTPSPTLGVTNFIRRRIFPGEYRDRSHFVRSHGCETRPLRASPYISRRGLD